VKEAVSYSEAFTLRPAEDVASVKYKNLDEARHKTAASGFAAVRGAYAVHSSNPRKGLEGCEAAGA
jgi:hypothetical protein